MSLNNRRIDALIGREADPSLKWVESRDHILASLKTVQGIADLAKVNRKTVYRLQIPPNSVEALEFVRDRRIKINRPLVVKRDEPLAWQNVNARFRATVSRIQSIREARHKDVKVTYRDPKLVARKGRRRLRITHDPDTRGITDEVRRQFERYGFAYEMANGRVSVKMLCSQMGISRQAFYKWRTALPVSQRQIIDDLMRA
ncbi:MAG: hypothetical protein ACPGVU_17885 [Limisphaerales bacterium]